MVNLGHLVILYDFALLKNPITLGPIAKSNSSQQTLKILNHPKIKEGYFKLKQNNKGNLRIRDDTVESHILHLRAK